MICIKKDDLIKEAFNKVKEEMTDHLESINENTNEINSLHDYIQQLEEKISKLSERLEDAELKVSEMSGKENISEKNFQDIILSSKEEEIFMLLYSGSGDLKTKKDIARSLGLTEELVNKHINSMLNKGIPIINKYFEEKTFVVLDPDFRNLQAKKNLIKGLRKA